MSQDSNFINFQEITDILKLPLIGTEEEISKIIQQQENICKRLISETEDDLDEFAQDQVIDTAFLNISNIQDTINIRRLIYRKKNPYPGFIRLLQHQDDKVVLCSLQCIGNILDGCVDSKVQIKTHPHYQQLVDFEGIQKLFSFFQQTSNKKLKDAASICIVDDDEWTSSYSRRALRHLYMDKFNRSEIISEDQLEVILQDLEQPLEGNEEEIKLIQQKQLCIALKPYNSLIRLLDHSDKQVVNNSFSTIYMILYQAANQTPIKTCHPHFQALSDCQGIEKLFDLFINKRTSVLIGFCIGIVFRGRMIQDPAMRTELINFIKSQIINPDTITNGIAKLVLSYLSLNAEKFMIPLIHLLDCNIKKGVLQIIHFLAEFLTKINENGKIQQEDEFRIVLERNNELSKLEQIFSADKFKDDDIKKYAAIIIASLYKALKIPDKFRFAVIDCLKEVIYNEYKYDDEEDLVELASLALSRIAECEDNGLVLALNLLRFGSEETQLKVKEGISLDYIRDLYLNPDEDQPETTAFSAKLIDEWMLTIS
ncbi:MAG: hypothetical protein EZS28_014139 [Streblomastix strix]|uniref:Uncharacterized protein n=1 Tax=Streblomastix strix TaxID=222440 RepID=A0A5J4W6I2_9EUKA|nr:MAG: hypothetical protein EZS28_014139 [Streblomastix strix]